MRHINRYPRQGMRLTLMLLPFVLMIAAWFIGLVTLHFEVIIIAKYIFEPMNSRFGSSHIPFHNMLRNFST